VVLATGLGKTWLSAFDSNRPPFRRVLFLAHREEILGQAWRTFRRIRPLATLGYYNGREKAPEADVLFASIQTLSRRRHLQRFDPRQFDYLVLDEFHHAAARSYRRLIGYFEPRFLLGLTATPERTDGADLLTLCGDNLVYRADMAEGVRRSLLSPFDYFGVPDEVDYANIPSLQPPRILPSNRAREVGSIRSLSPVWREPSGSFDAGIPRTLQGIKKIRSRN